MRRTGTEEGIPLLENIFQDLLVCSRFVSVITGKGLQSSRGSAPESRERHEAEELTRWGTAISMKRINSPGSLTSAYERKRAVESA